MSDQSTYLHPATANPLGFDAKQLPTLHPSCYILRSSFLSHDQHRLHLQPVNHILALVPCKTQDQLRLLEYWIPLQKKNCYTLCWITFFHVDNSHKYGWLEP
jgi:hypothetical protein